MANRDAKLIERTLKDFSLGAMSGSNSSNNDNAQFYDWMGKLNTYNKWYFEKSRECYEANKAELENVGGSYYVVYTAYPKSTEEFFNEFKKTLSKHVPLNSKLSDLIVNYDHFTGPILFGEFVGSWMFNFTISRNFSSWQNFFYFEIHRDHIFLKNNIVSVVSVANPDYTGIETLEDALNYLWENGDKQDPIHNWAEVPNDTTDRMYYVSYESKIQEGVFLRNAPYSYPIVEGVPILDYLNFFQIEYTIEQGED